MMRSPLRVGCFLLVVLAWSSVSLAQQSASRDADYETALQEMEALRAGRATAPAPAASISSQSAAEPSSAQATQPQAPTVPANVDREPRVGSGALLQLARPIVRPAAPTPTVEQREAPTEPAVEESTSVLPPPQNGFRPATRDDAPRGILAPLFGRGNAETPRVANNDRRSIFRQNTQPSRPAPAPAQPTEPPVAQTPTPESTPSRTVMTVPSETIGEPSNATLSLAERGVAPPAIAPAPPQNMFVPAPAAPAPTFVDSETVIEDPRPQVVESPAPTPAEPPSATIAEEPTPAPQVADAPAPAPQVANAPSPAPVTSPEYQTRPDLGPHRVLTIDRNDPSSSIPSVMRRPAPSRVAHAPVLRPVTPEPPALPDLTVFMSGDEKVLQGENVAVKVRVVNSGNGAAREVILDIVGNDQLLKTLPVGAIPPGRSVEVEIQLTPQVLGELEVQAVAKARQGDRAVAVRSMFVGKPQLSLAIAGPATMKFGEVQIYTAIVDNKGNADAEDVSLLVMLQGKEAQSLVLGNVLAGQRRRVSFELRPELGGVLSLNAVATGFGGVQAVANGSINVMQQQIQLTIDGPRTLRFGDAARYSLNIQNSGNTDAERVTVNVNLGDSVLDGLFEGTLAMGEKKQLLFEVSPSRPGNQTLTAVALTESGTSAAANARLQVQHGQLELSAAGPSAKFSGGEATYDVKVKNVGDAAAEDVLVTAHLPEGAQFVGGVDKIEFYEGITWRVGTLAPGEEKHYPLECVLEAAGEQSVVFSASGSGELTATHEVRTAVEALADVRLFVADPQGLVPIGEDAVYEIELHNRGVKAAEDVQLKLLLGDAIRPKSTEGLAAQLNPTGVIFQTIDRLEAKETRKIRVTLQAISEGSHQFRVEATAANPETFVASEGTTRFYAKAKPIAPSPSSELPVERTADPQRSTWR